VTPKARRRASLLIQGGAFVAVGDVPYFAWWPRGRKSCWRQGRRSGHQGSLPLWSDDDVLSFQWRSCEPLVWEEALVTKDMKLRSSGERLRKLCVLRRMGGTRMEQGSLGTGDGVLEESCGGCCGRKAGMRKNNT